MTRTQLRFAIDSTNNYVLLLILVSEELNSYILHLKNSAIYAKNNKENH